jgi:5-formyltetrahydrofolate cyclo-ligase
MMNVGETKSALRRSLKGGILAMDPAERAEQERALSVRFSTLPGFASARVILLYARAFAEEIDTGPMLRAALEAGKSLVCPRVIRAENRLRLFRVEDLDADFEGGVLGIPEPRAHCPEVAPEDIDWVLVPGLGFDRQGFRLGRGAGHYDRLLPRLRREVPRWGLILTPQWVDALPVEPHDQPLDGVADHRELIEFARPSAING